MEGGEGCEEFNVKTKKENPDTSLVRAEAICLKFCWWNIILSVLLVGSVVLKLVVILAIFSAFQCTPTEKQTEKHQGLNFSENLVYNSCTKADMLFANVILDPDTAYRKLVILENGKSVQWKGDQQDVLNNPERFDPSPCVLGQKGFTSGSHWWETQLVTGHAWVVGVARASLERKGKFISSPEWSFWVVGNCSNNALGFYYTCPPTNMQNIWRIRVSLNYAGGQVLFFDPDSGLLVNEFTSNFSGDTIYPFFCVGFKTHLRLSPGHPLH